MSISGVFVLLPIVPPLEFPLMRQAYLSFGGGQCHAGQLESFMRKVSYMEAFKNKIEKFLWLNLLRHIDLSL